MNRQNPHTPDGAPADAEFVVYRLEEAGATLLALPSTGHTTRLRQSVLDVVREAADAYAGAAGRVRAAPPPPARITRMDEALGWVARIPADKVVLRRIVGARALVSPTTERHLFTWRRLAGVVGADHKAVQRWHAQGIELIVQSLNRPTVSGPAVARGAPADARTALQAASPRQTQGARALPQGARALRPSQLAREVL